MDTSVSILIPAWNEEKIIKKTIKWLNKLNLPFKYSEIIFIAGGDDKTYETCKNLELTNFNSTITIKQESSDFKTGALIKGMKKSKGMFLILIDADTIVAPNFVIEVIKALQKFDAVNCDFFPMIQKGFWYKFFIINKLIWAKNPHDLPSLFGAATISLTRKVVDKIGIENFFTNKSTAGVDHFMGLVLKSNNISIGLIRNSRVITPRPGCLRDFIKDQLRWFTAFFKLHENEKKIIIFTFIQSTISILIPIIGFFFILNKLKDIEIEKIKKIKYIFILFFVEYLMNFLKLKVIIEKRTKRLKVLGHFKGSRY